MLGRAVIGAEVAQEEVAGGVHALLVEGGRVPDDGLSLACVPDGCAVRREDRWGVDVAGVQRVREGHRNGRRHGANEVGGCTGCGGGESREDGDEERVEHGRWRVETKDGSKKPRKKGGKD